MTALPSDVAKYTQDGVLVRSSPSEATTIKAIFPGAREEEESPRESFFRYESDCVAVEATRFAFLKRLGPVQEEIETATSLGPTAFTIAPVAPKVTVVDGPSENGYVGIIRAFVRTTDDDRFALSVVEG